MKLVPQCHLTTPLSKLPTVLLPPELVAASTLVARMQLLSQTVLPSRSHYKAPKGHSETQFERDLWQYFPNQIHAGLVMLRADRVQPYVPDFSYINAELNLHIDIEVDEPYTHDTRQPLHYLSSEKDERRNQFFLDAGWIVIRFSEKQVVKSPMSCCKAIASTIASITQNNAIMIPFRHVPVLKPESRWTYNEAEQMAAIAYREQYLQPLPTPPPSKRKSRKRSSASSSKELSLTASLTFYCPACGDGPILWKGHYIACPTCYYDDFVV